MPLPDFQTMMRPILVSLTTGDTLSIPQIRALVAGDLGISDEEQQLRFLTRIHDPMKQWKLSPMDLQSRVRWEDYTAAKEEMLKRTDTPEARWYIVEGNDKRRARLNCIDHLLKQIPYTEVPQEVVALPERKFNPNYERHPIEKTMFVPRVYG